MVWWWLACTVGDEAPPRFVHGDTGLLEASCSGPPLGLVDLGDCPRRLRGESGSFEQGLDLSDEGLALGWSPDTGEAAVELYRGPLDEDWSPEAWVLGGWSFGFLADLDGDGREELAVRDEGVAVLLSPLEGELQREEAEIVLPDCREWSTGRLSDGAVPEVVCGWQPPAEPGLGGGTVGEVLLFDALHLGENGPEEASFRAFPEEASLELGERVAVLGDLDGDGLDELGASAVHDAGREALWLRYGPIGPGEEAVSWGEVALVGPALASLSPGGDVDGDGLDELLVGGTEGRAWLFLEAPGPGAERSGAEVRWELEGHHALEALVVGDLDQDGFEDVAIGSHRFANQRSAVFLYYGPLSGQLDEAQADATVVAPEVELSLGALLDGGHDLSGDGYPDLVVGASISRFEDDEALEEGVWLLPGGPR